MVMSSSAGVHPAVFAPIRDLFFFLLQSQRGMLLISLWHLDKQDMLSVIIINYCGMTFMMDVVKGFWCQTTVHCTKCMIDNL